MKRGDIYFVSLDPTVGHEQHGTRPVLIVSSESFNRQMKLPIILPVTTGGNFARIHGFAVSLHGTGLKTSGVIRCDQPRTLDVLARNGRFVERLTGEVMKEVMLRTAGIFAVANS